MPVFNDNALPRPKGLHAEPIESRPVITFGATMTTSRQIQTGFRKHRKSQFILVLQGVFHCEMNERLWIVPTQSAIWVPGDYPIHDVKIKGPFEGYVTFIAPEAASRLPSSCCAVSTTPLLRELIIRDARFPVAVDPPENDMEGHLAALLVDEIVTAPPGDFHLPMPTDRRLRKVVDMIMANPAERGTMDTWASRAGLSKRTLARLLLDQTGMSFGRWRQQLKLMLAVEWLAEGTSIQQVAFDLGYESAGSFVTMFRKALGTSPGRYMAERHAPHA